MRRLEQEYFNLGYATCTRFFFFFHSLVSVDVLVDVLFTSLGAIFLEMGEKMTCYGPLLNHYDEKEIRRGPFFFFFFFFFFFYAKKLSFFSPFFLSFLFILEREINPHFAKLMEDFEKNCFGTFDFFMAGLLAVTFCF